MAKESESPGTLEKALLISFFIFLGAFGLTNLIIGSINIDRCGGAKVLPVFLVVNGVAWVVPSILLLVINFHKKEDDIGSCYSFLEKVFLISFCLLFCGTIYVAVSATQVRTLEVLCTYSWVPPFAIAVIVADWILFGVFFRLFCVVKLPQEKPPTQFRHLQNLPPLYLPWNRHRQMRY